MIIEYRFLKKILYISIIVIITLIVLYYYLSTALGDIFSTILSQDQSLRNLYAKVNSYVEKLQPQIEEVLNRGGSADEVGRRLVDIYAQDKQSFDLVQELGAKENAKIASIFPAGVVLIGPIYSLLFMIPIVPVSIIIKLLLEHARKEFLLYYAIGCFKIVTKKGTHELDKLIYFKIGLIWYNKFLKKISIYVLMT